MQNVDELFDRSGFTAAPDPLWPDCFNSGVFILEPSMDTYNGLLRMLFDSGSFDGREQVSSQDFIRLRLLNTVIHVVE